MFREIIFYKIVPCHKINNICDKKDVSKSEFPKSIQESFRRIPDSSRNQITVTFAFLCEAFSFIFVVTFLRPRPNTIISGMYVYVCVCARVCLPREIIPHVHLASVADTPVYVRRTRLSSTNVRKT